MRMLTVGRGGFSRVRYGAKGEGLLALTTVVGFGLWDLRTFTEGRFLGGDEATVAHWLVRPGGERFLRVQGLWPDDADLPFGRLPAALPWRDAAPVSGWREQWWLAFGPDGRSVLRVARPEEWNLVPLLALWGLHGQILRAFADHPRRQKTATFSPDGALLATTPVNSLACVWSAATGERIANLEHTDVCLRLAFSPDGRWLATAAGRTVRLWDLEDFRCAGRFRSFRRFAYALAFSPDGRRLAAGSQEGRVRLWDVASGKEVADYDWGAGEVRDLAFAPDGSTAAAACRNALVVWDVDP